MIMLTPIASITTEQQKSDVMKFVPICRCFIVERRNDAAVYLSVSFLEKIKSSKQSEMLRDAVQLQSPTSAADAAGLSALCNDKPNRSSQPSLTFKQRRRHDDCQYLTF